MMYFKYNSIDFATSDFLQYELCKYCELEENLWTISLHKVQFGACSEQRCITVNIILVGTKAKE